MPCARVFPPDRCQARYRSHGAAADRLNQTRYPQQRIAAQFQWIAETVVQPAQNDVNSLQAAKRSEINTTIEHRQVCSFHQRAVPLACKKRVLEIRFAE